MKEARAKRREQAGGPITEPQWSGIKAPRPKRVFEQADLDARLLFCVCPLHGAVNLSARQVLAAGASGASLAGACFCKPTERRLRVDNSSDTMLIST